MAPLKQADSLSYYSGGTLHKHEPGRLRSAKGRASAGGARRGRGRGSSAARKVVQDVAGTLHAQQKRLSGAFPRFHDLSEIDALSMAALYNDTVVIPTETIVIEAKRQNDAKSISKDFALDIIQEGRRGKWLLRAPEGGKEGVELAFKAARAAHGRSGIVAAHPNFLRVVRHPASSTGTAKRFWNLDNNGHPGVPGADVHALAVWTITEGDPDVRVAVLDEGVDTLHSHLRNAVVAQADFVDGNDHARPDGDDAHGTACAGIVVSRHSTYRGLAPEASLVAVRIAKSDDRGYWVFDDFDTADAIDWSWDDAKADVLSNSWGGGPSTDVITRAFERARTQGRNGKGSVIVVAAGNDQQLVDFPANLPSVLGVGASNQWDKRKTTSSADGEYWWGSNYGPGLDLMAPGVRIPTTDIRGRRGYSGTLFTNNFNGTSSAAPHVAAAAALVLSANPKLSEAQVRDILTTTTDPLTVNPGWDQYTGYGRLNSYRAVWTARRS